MKKIIMAGIATALVTLTGCSDADIASRNLSQDADQFKVPRRVVFLNGITDKYILSIEGNCSIQPQPRQVDVIGGSGASRQDPALVA